MTISDTPQKTVLVDCAHCGNTTHHQILVDQQARRYFDSHGDDKYYENHIYQVLLCPTCDGLSIYGGFTEFLNGGLYGSCLYPKVTLDDKVPSPIKRVYREAWPIKSKAPGAFAVQIRRKLLRATGELIKGAVHEKCIDAYFSTIRLSGIFHVHPLFSFRSDVGYHRRMVRLLVAPVRKSKSLDELSRFSSS